MGSVFGYPGRTQQSTSLGQAEMYREAYSPLLQDLRARIAEQQQMLDMLRMMSLSNPNMRICDALANAHYATHRGRQMENAAQAAMAQEMAFSEFAAAAAATAAPRPSRISRIHPRAMVQSGYEVDMDSSTNSDAGHVPITRPLATKHARTFVQPSLPPYETTELDVSRTSAASGFTTEQDLDSSIESNISVQRAQGGPPPARYPVVYGALPLAMFTRKGSDGSTIPEVSPQITVPATLEEVKESRKRPVHALGHEDLDTLLDEGLGLDWTHIAP